MRRSPSGSVASRSVVAGLIVLGVPGCTASPTDSPAPDALSAAKGPPGPSNSPATFWLPLAGPELRLRGDGLFPDGTQSRYTDGVCGVKATVYAPNPTQDAVLQTDNPRARDRKCVAYGSSTWPRRVVIDFGDDIESVPVTLNVHDLGVVTGTQKRFLGISGTSRCERLQWGGPGGGDSVWVSRTSATTWRVYSQAAPNTSAACVTGNGSTLYADMIVDFVVTTP